MFTGACVKENEILVETLRQSMSSIKQLSLAFKIWIIYVCHPCICKYFRIKIFLNQNMDLKSIQRKEGEETGKKS